MNDVKLQKDDQTYKISMLNENIKMNFRHDESFITSFITSRNNDDILIKDTFLFAIINLDILSELHIPSIFTMIVEQNNWKKY
jgi:hypothetical protein